MSDQSKVLHKAVITKNENFNYLNISIRFFKGQSCLSSARPMTKGLYLVINPIHEQTQGVFRSTRMVRFTGFKMLIKPLSRFSQKQLDDCLPDLSLLHYAISDVVMNNNISLQTDEMSHDEHILKITNKYSLNVEAA